MRERGTRRILWIALGCLGCLGLAAGSVLWRRYGYWLTYHLTPPPPLPDLPTAAPYTPWPTPTVAEAFDYPLLPADAYAPYVPGVSGPLPVDTRYGFQNPAMGNNSNCFRDAAGDPVPFGQLYHAGVDLFAVDDRGQTIWGAATHVPVHAVADGVVLYTLDAGSDGEIVIVEHLLPDESAIFSVYWHVDYVQVRRGQPVTRGQVIAVVMDKGPNSHLHWEMRTFEDGADLFPAGSAGAPGCNGHVAGVGYTWDDDSTRAHPEVYGYLDPVAFVETHQ
ncbi:MAG: M23 family metallopeptidase [Anaerolineae bacterium]|nr:M23 family metallopeptidase [Anaerolineae bacterium]